MSKARVNTIQILNPLAGGARYTSRKSALQFVRRGLAVLEADNTALRFLDQDRRSLDRKQNDPIGGRFWWRRGKTGGFAQLIGSNIYPLSQPGNLDKIK